MKKARGGWTNCAPTPLGIPSPGVHSLLQRPLNLTNLEVNRQPGAKAEPDIVIMLVGNKVLAMPGRLNEKEAAAAAQVDLAEKSAHDRQVWPRSRETFFGISENWAQVEFDTAAAFAAQQGLLFEEAATTPMDDGFVMPEASRNRTGERRDWRKHQAVLREAAQSKGPEESLKLRAGFLFSEVQIVLLCGATPRTSEVAVWVKSQVR